MSLVSKYNVPAPRYTSYPTVPYWDNHLSQDQWIGHVRESFKENKASGISVYIHLPFCESLCTYCACNTRITVNHNVEIPYIEAVIKEWRLYLKQFEKRPLLKEIHLGGGTPTFFSPENLYYLLNSIISTCDITPEYDFSFEGHPSSTSKSHLELLYGLGFKRVSFGVQDFDPTVQEAINRWQTFDEVNTIVNKARSIGYNSVNIDLVYGLPHQTIHTVQNTIKQVIELKPERIAFYSYAHVPWLKPGQRRYSEKDLPLDEVKRELYVSGRRLLQEAGYSDIGMDHFALNTDSLYKASVQKTLHRNFMGYTSERTGLLIGLGCSAISDSWTAFSQNIKTVEEYQKAVNADSFPIAKGHIHTKEDLYIRQHILDIMCRLESTFESVDSSFLFEKIQDELKKLEADGLISLDKNKISVTEPGRQFLRNICLVLDRRYSLKSNSQKLFSTTA